MIEIHHTEDGRLLFISQMTDDHLCNMIRRQLRIVKELTAIIAQEPMSQNRRELIASLYNINPEADREDAKARLPEVVRGLYPYLSEALLRGLSDLTTDMQVAFGRTSKEEDSIKVPRQALNFCVVGTKTGRFSSTQKNRSALPKRNIMDVVIDGLPDPLGANHADEDDEY